MCSNMHSGCQSLGKCTFLYNYRHKYIYETHLNPPRLSEIVLMANIEFRHGLRPG